MKRKRGDAPGTILEGRGALAITRGAQQLTIPVTLGERPVSA